MGRLLQGERHPTNRCGGRFVHQDPCQLHENRHTAGIVVGAGRTQRRVVVGAHHYNGNTGVGAGNGGDDVAILLSAAFVQILRDPVSGLSEDFFDVNPGSLQATVAARISLPHDSGQELDVVLQPELKLPR